MKKMREKEGETHQINRQTVLNIFLQVISLKVKSNAIPSGRLCSKEGLPSVQEQLWGYEYGFKL